MLCAQSQGMYWFLVMRADLGVKRGDLDAVRGRRIGAAPWVDLGLRRLLIEAGIDPVRDVTIAPIPGTLELKVNTGVMAAKALEDRVVDGFWANGMGAETRATPRRRNAGARCAPRRRTEGLLRLHDGYRRGGRARWCSGRPNTAAAAIRAVVATQAALRQDPALAGKVGQKLFPAQEAALIGDLVARDAPFYRAAISEATFSAMSRFARDVGILDGSPSYDDVVATDFRHLWQRSLPSTLPQSSEAGS